MEKSQIYRQILVAAIGNLISAGFGLALGWSSPMVPKLQDQVDSPLSRTLEAAELGLIGSLVPIGGVIAPVFAGTIADKFGRKIALLSSGFCLLSGYIILGVGRNIFLVYLGRFIHGFTVGLTMTVMPMYIGEIVHDSIRGALGTFMMLFMSVGSLLAFCIGPFVSYSTFQFICAAIPTLFLVSFAWMPETPTYYLIAGRKEQAIKSLMFLRKTTENNVLAELEQIERCINERPAKGSWTNLFKEKSNVRALVICCGLILVQQFSGINPIVYYSQFIFQQAGGDLDPVYSAIIVGAVPVTVCWLVPFAVERVGRKSLLMITATVMAISLALLSIYFFLMEHNATMAATISFIPILSLVCYLICMMFGFGPIPWTMVGELFPPDIKTHATIIVSMVSSGSAAIILLGFPIFNYAVGPFWVFATFTICVIIGIGFVYLFVIETKGLTLLEIQNKLKNI